ncbi:MAG: PadR family transcriptional regulator [Acidobacteriota bacterium]
MSPKQRQGLPKGRKIEAPGAPERPEILQGTLDLLILRVLAPEEMHGWAISRRIQQVSDDVLLVQQGSLYPSLHRLLRKGWLEARWGTSEKKRRARFYRLTEAGRQQLAEESENWNRLSAAVTRVLEFA